MHIISRIFTMGSVKAELGCPYLTEIYTGMKRWRQLLRTP